VHQQQQPWLDNGALKIFNVLLLIMTLLQELEKYLSAHADKAQELQAKQLLIEELKLSLQQQDQRLHDQQQELQEVKQAAAEVQCRADARLEGINSLTLALDACQQVSNLVHTLTGHKQLTAGSQTQ